MGNQLCEHWPPFTLGDRRPSSSTEIAAQWAIPPEDSVYTTFPSSIFLYISVSVILYFCFFEILPESSLHTHCTMGQAVEIDILEVHKSKQILHAHL